MILETTVEVDSEKGVLNADSKLWQTECLNFLKLTEVMNAKKYTKKKSPSSK